MQHVCKGHWPPLAFICRSLISLKKSGSFSHAVSFCPFTPLLHCSKSERWTFHLEKGSSQIGWVLAWDGKTLLLCRQVHKRAINNLRPANYWTFSNTHGPGCFCLTNLYLKHFHLQIELNIVCTVKTDISYWPRNVFFIEILQSLLDDTFLEGSAVWYSDWLLQGSWWQNFPYFRVRRAAWSGGVWLFWKFNITSQLSTYDII